MKNDETRGWDRRGIDEALSKETRGINKGKREGGTTREERLLVAPLCPQHRGERQRL